jgi:hypothetical protein
MTMSNWSVTHALYAASSPFRLFPSLWIDAEISCKSPTRWDFWHVTLPTNGGELSSKYGPLLSAELCLFLATIRSLNRFYLKMKSYRLNVAIFVVGHSATGLRLYWVSAEHDTQPNFVKNEKKNRRSHFSTEESGISVSTCLKHFTKLTFLTISTFKLKMNGKWGQPGPLTTATAFDQGRGALFQSSLVRLVTKGPVTSATTQRIKC